VEKRSNHIVLRRVAAVLAGLLILGFAAAALWPEHSSLAPVFASREGTTIGQLDQVIGATVEPLDPATARSLGLSDATQGMVVTSVASEGAAARAGVRTGDVIVAVDRSVNSVKDLTSGLAKNDVLTVTLNRHGQSVIVPLRLGSRRGDQALFEKE
jgi:predicted metalloprotease with PDZ domain